MNIFCIGDIHGKLYRLSTLLEGLPERSTVICVGDIGLGFPDTKTPQCLDDVDQIARNKNHQVWLLRGNHDDPNIWKKDRYTWNDHLTNVRIARDVHRLLIDNIHIIMVGGAISVDRIRDDRLEGKNWWSGEAVSSNALSLVEDLVETYGKVDLLATHVGPFEAEPKMDKDEDTINYYSQTDLNLRSEVEAERRLISEIVVKSQAKQAVFGHYHIATETTLGRIQYRCCAELEVWQYVKKASSLPPLPSLH